MGSGKRAGGCGFRVRIYDGGCMQFHLEMWREIRLNKADNSLLKCRRETSLSSFD